MLEKVGMMRSGEIIQTINTFLVIIRKSPVERKKGRGETAKIP